MRLENFIFKKIKIMNTFKGKEFELKLKIIDEFIKWAKENNYSTTDDRLLFAFLAGAELNRKNNL